jgi:hypothetical protein
VTILPEKAASGPQSLSLIREHRGVSGCASSRLAEVQVSEPQTHKRAEQREYERLASSRLAEVQAETSEPC